MEHNIDGIIILKQIFVNDIRLIILNVNASKERHNCRWMETYSNMYHNTQASTQDQ